MKHLLKCTRQSPSCSSWRAFRAVNGFICTQPQDWPLAGPAELSCARVTRAVSSQLPARQGHRFVSGHTKDTTHFTDGHNEFIPLKSRGGSGNDIRPLCETGLANEQEKSPADLLRICPRVIWADKLVFSDTEFFHCFAPHLVISSSRKGVGNDCQFSFTFYIHSVQVWMTVQGRQQWEAECQSPECRIYKTGCWGDWLLRVVLLYFQGNLTGICCTGITKLLLQLLWPKAAFGHRASPLLKSGRVLFRCWPAEFVSRQIFERKLTEVNTGK